MEQVFSDDKVGKIYYDTELEAVVAASKPQEGNLLPEEDYKDFLKKYLEAFLHFKPQKALMDFREFVFPLTEEIEQWTIENISNITYDNGLRYVAYVYPKEIVTQFSLESFVEKMLKTYKENGPVRMIFSDFNEAYNWLKSK